MNLDFLHALLTEPGPSSFEHRPARLWRDQAEGYGASLARSAYGSSFATFGTGRPRVMLCGHIDEIGLVIHHIDDKGMLYFQGIGGWDPQQLVGQRIRLVGPKEDIIGVIGKKPIHLLDASDQSKAGRIRDMWIDIGAKDAAEACEHVRIGDYGVIEQPPVTLLNQRLVSKAIDNRIGAYIVLEAARRAHTGGATAEIIAVATAQEEIGGVGANTSAFALDPDVAIAVDVTHATDIPDVSKTQLGDIPLGSGPTLTTGAIVHHGAFQMLRNLADEKEIPYRIETAARYTRTDADFIAPARKGVPSLVVSIPNRYMHSPNEMIDLEDLEQVITLIELFLISLDETSTFTQPDG